MNTTVHDIFDKRTGSHTGLFTTNRRHHCSSYTVEGTCTTEKDQQRDHTSQRDHRPYGSEACESWEHLNEKAILSLTRALSQPENPSSSLCDVAPRTLSLRGRTSSVIPPPSSPSSSSGGSRKKAEHSRTPCVCGEVGAHPSRQGLENCIFFAVKIKVVSSRSQIFSRYS